MSMEWFRWWHGCISDPKFTTVARRAKQPRAIVIAIWAALLEHASQAQPRGSIARFCVEDAANLLEVDEACITQVIAELERKGLITKNDISSWAQRQPQREDYSTERVKKHRKMKRSETQCNAESVNETQVKRIGNTDSDSDSDSDTDPEAEQRGKDVKAHACAVHDDESPLSPSVQVSYSSDFEQAWQLYPTRIGGNSKQIAYRAWQKRLQEGHTVAAMTEGTQRYAAFCQATNVRGTRYVKQAGTFFGPGLHFTEAWIIPPPGDGGDPQPHNASPITQLSKAGQQQVRNAEAWLQQHNVVSAEVLSSELN